MARRRSELAKRPAGRLDTGDSGNAAATELLPLVPEEGAGGGIVVQRGSDVIEGHGALPARPEDVLAEPPDARDISAELAAPPRRKLPWLTLLLSAGVVAVAAFTGGVLVEKHHHDNNSAANPLSALGNARGGTFGAGRTGGTGFTGFGGATAGTGSGTGTGAGGMTFGTVKLVDGDTIYVTDAQGNTVKVTTSGSTKVKESKDGKVADLKPGQTITVQGSKNSSGDVAATTVTQGGTLPAGGGGFPGFGGGAGGASGSASGGSGGGGK